MAIRDFRDLIVWQKAMDLVELIYELTREFPDEERFGLRLQLRKASVSVPSNIAEGNGRYSTKDYLRFLSISSGSLRETQTDVLVAKRLRYINDDKTIQAMVLCEEVARLLSRLVQSLRRSKLNRTPRRPP